MAQHNQQDSSIVEGARVTLHFSLSLETGDIVDSNYAGKPASFHVGDGSLLPGFEECLLGMGINDEIEKKLPAEQAFGEINPRNVHSFPAAKFKSLIEDPLNPAEVGSIVSFQDPGGGDLPGVITRLNKDTITVDFNHPLAGKAIVFRAKILAIIPPGTSALAIS